MKESLLVWIFWVFFPLMQGILIYGLYRSSRQSRELRVTRDNLVQQRNTTFGFIHDMGEVFTDSLDVNIQGMLDKALFYATRTCNARAAAVYLLDQDHEKLEARAIAGIFPPLHEGVALEPGSVTSRSSVIDKMVRENRFEFGEGLIGEAAIRGAALLIEDAELDDRVPKHKTDFLKILSMVLVPMRFGRSVVGVVVVVNRADGQPFTQTDANLLQSLADQSAVPLHYAGLSKLVEEKKQMDRDMRVAHEIQCLLLPQQLPELDDFGVAAFNHPAMAIGGDYYDFIHIDKDHLGFAIADVSGKGIGGAMIMSSCRSFVRALAPAYYSPAGMLRQLNRRLSGDLTEDMFVSMLYMILNLKTRRLLVARAGHERPILNRGGANCLMDGDGIAIGLTDAEVFDSLISDAEYQLEAGDMVVAYTDGITEAMDEEDDEWGVENLQQAVSDMAVQGTTAMIAETRQRILNHIGARAQYDDMTIVSFRVK
ncbi:PP2C family protein-serine/threonine phosphatase [Verrucomicrobiota bacterium]